MNDHLLKSIQNAVIQLLFENIHFHSQIIIRIALEKVSEHLFKYRPQYWWPYLCVPSRRYCFMPSINLEYISLNRLINLLNSLCISYHRNYPNLLFLFCPYHFLLYVSIKHLRPRSIIVKVPTNFILIFEVFVTAYHIDIWIIAINRKCNIPFMWLIRWHVAKHILA